MNSNASEAEDVSFQLERVEIAVKRQELVHNRIKLALAVTGVLGAGVGLVVERSAALAQRHETAAENVRQHHVDRMVKISDELGALIRQTSGLLVSANSSVMRAARTADMAIDDLEAIDQRSDAMESALSHLLQLQELMGTEDDWLDLTKWKASIELQAKWNAPGGYVSPDFEFYFGSELRDEVSELAEAAWDAVEDFGTLTLEEGSEEVGRRFNADAERLLRKVRERLRLCLGP